MAAAQVMGEPRVCACGCGASLEDRHHLTVYTRDCRERLKQKRDVERHRAKAKQRRERLGHKSLHPLKSAVWRGTANDATHVPTLKCGVCCDMPWARLSTRSVKDSDGSIEPVANVDGKCRGCGEKYAPEPKPEHGSLLRSSAGTAQKASELWGYQPNLGGVERTKAYRAKKAKGQNDGEV